MRRVFHGSSFPAAAAVLAAVLLCTICGRVSGQALSRDRIEERLEAGQDAYRRAVELDRTDPAAAKDYYRKAILNFESIAEEGGIDNGRLYYNIGNAWFRLGDLGHAILNYRRAMLYTPGDPNLLQNLEFARSRRISRIEPGQSEKVFKTLFFLHYDVPARVRAMIFASAFVLLWALASLHIFHRRHWVRIAIGAAAAVSVLTAVSLAVERISLRSSPPGVVVAGEVTARKGDAETYQPTFTEPLHAGTEFELVEKRGDWWYIELEDGVRCWITAASGELVIEG